MEFLIGKRKRKISTENGEIHKFHSLYCKQMGAVLNYECGGVQWVRLMFRKLS